MAKLRAETDDGTTLHVHLPQLVVFGLGFLNFLLVGAVSFTGHTLLEIRDQNARYEEQLKTQSTRLREFELTIDQLVSRREYDAMAIAWTARLDRIENKLDQALARRTP